MGLWDYRFFAISSDLAMRNIRVVGRVLTVLNHFHLFPSGPLAQSAEGARRDHLLCSREETRLADFAQVVMGGAALGRGNGRLRAECWRTARRAAGRSLAARRRRQALGLS